MMIKDYGLLPGHELKTVKAQGMPRFWNHDAYADSAIREPY